MHVFLGDIDKGRKLAMAHKNVRILGFILPFTCFLQNYVMRGSRQSLPTLIEECSDTKLLCALATMLFDSGQAYSNSKVIFFIEILFRLRKRCNKIIRVVMSSVVPISQTPMSWIPKICLKG